MIIKKRKKEEEDEWCVLRPSTFLQFLSVLSTKLETNVCTISHGQIENGNGDEDFNDSGREGGRHVL